MSVPAISSMLWPAPLAVILAFCSIEWLAFTLVLPAVLLSAAPSVMSLVLPMACTSTLPAAVIAPPAARLLRLPAAVVITKLPALLTLLCAVSVVALSVTPSLPTRLTVNAAVWPMLSALASCRYNPALPLLALKITTSVSSALLPWPMPPVVGFALKRSSLAYTSTVVFALSNMLPPVDSMLTLPQLA